MASPGHREPLGLKLQAVVTSRLTNATVSDLNTKRWALRSFHVGRAFNAASSARLGFDTEAEAGTLGAAVFVGSMLRAFLSTVSATQMFEANLAVGQTVLRHMKHKHLARFSLV